MTINWLRIREVIEAQPILIKDAYRASGQYCAIGALLGDAVLDKMPIHSHKWGLGALWGEPYKSRLAEYGLDYREASGIQRANDCAKGDIKMNVLEYIDKQVPRG